MDSNTRRRETLSLDLSKMVNRKKMVCLGSYSFVLIVIIISKNAALYLNQEKVKKKKKRKKERKKEKRFLKKGKVHIKGSEGRVSQVSLELHVENKQTNKYINWVSA